MQRTVDGMRQARRSIHVFLQSPEAEGQVAKRGRCEERLRRVQAPVHLSTLDALVDAVLMCVVGAAAFIV